MRCEILGPRRAYQCLDFSGQFVMHGQFVHACSSRRTRSISDSYNFLFWNILLATKCKSLMDINPSSFSILSMASAACVLTDPQLKIWSSCQWLSTQVGARLGFIMQSRRSRQTRRWLSSSIYPQLECPTDPACQNSGSHFTTLPDIFCLNDLKYITAAKKWIFSWTVDAWTVNVPTPNIAKLAATVERDIPPAMAPPNDMDALNGNSESMLAFPRKNYLHQAGLEADFFGNTVLQLHLLSFSFVCLKILYIYY